MNLLVLEPLNPLNAPLKSSVSPLAKPVIVAALLSLVLAPLLNLIVSLIPSSLFNLIVSPAFTSLILISLPLVPAFKPLNPVKLISLLVPLSIVKEPEPVFIKSTVRFRLSFMLS